MSTFCKIVVKQLQQILIDEQIVTALESLTRLTSAPVEMMLAA